MYMWWLPILCSMAHTSQICPKRMLNNQLGSFLTSGMAGSPSEAIFVACMKGRRLKPVFSRYLGIHPGPQPMPQRVGVCHLVKAKNALIILHTFGSM